MFLNFWVGYDLIEMIHKPFSNKEKRVYFYICSSFIMSLILAITVVVNSVLDEERAFPKYLSCLVVVTYSSMLISAIVFTIYAGIKLNA